MSNVKGRGEEDAIKYINEGGGREKRRKLRSLVTYKKPRFRQGSEDSFCDPSRALDISLRIFNDMP
jgi:hypothetical protein